jgi:hypothetical protein
MFSLENHPLDSTARVAIDQTTESYFLIADGFKHWLPGESVRKRCGFNYSKAKAENLDNF